MGVLEKWETFFMTVERLQTQTKVQGIEFICRQMSCVARPHTRDSIVRTTIVTLD